MQSVQICDPSDSEQAKQICGKKNEANLPAGRQVCDKKRSEASTKSSTYIYYILLRNISQKK